MYAFIIYLSFLIENSSVFLMSGVCFVVASFELTRCGLDPKILYTRNLYFIIIIKSYVFFLAKKTFYSLIISCCFVSNKC